MGLLHKCLRLAVAALMVVSSALAAVEKEDVTLESVARLAEARAREVFKDLRGSLPPELNATRTESSIPNRRNAATTDSRVSRVRVLLRNSWAQISERYFMSVS